MEGEQHTGEGVTGQNEEQVVAYEGQEMVQQNEEQNSGADQTNTLGVDAYGMGGSA